MTILYENGNYRIRTEKGDLVTSGWVGAIVFVCIMGFVFGGLFTLVSISANNPNFPPIYPLSIMSISLITGVVCVTYGWGCGAIITLEHKKSDEKTSPCENRWYPDRSYSYRFSGDAKRDADKLDQVVQRYKETIINMIANENRRLDAQKQIQKDCCTQYKDVVSQMKTAATKEEGE